MPSLVASLAPGMASGRLPVTPAERYVLVLVDGLGWYNLHHDSSKAPLLTAMEAQQLTVPVPSSTATSLTSLTTGVDTTSHGVVGFSFRTRPGVVLNTMAWDDPLSPPETVQAVPTWFEKGGVPCAAVVPQIFQGSGLTRAYLRGAELVGVCKEKDWAARVRQVVEVATSYPLTFVYERSLDHIAHLKGWQSSLWRRTLADIDRFIGDLLASLPPGTGVFVTGDHGMIDVPKTHRVFIEDEPQLAEGVTLIGGEGRLRHLYTDDPCCVAERWTQWLGSRGQVRLRADALEWFGETVPTPEVLHRVGDVVVALNHDWAVLTLTRPGEAGLIGMHGSLSQAERTVPLLKGES